MPRKPIRSRKKPKVVLNPIEIAYLSDDESLIDTGSDRWVLRSLRHGKHAWNIDPAELWAKHQDDFLPKFIRENPCRRPLPWWQYEAPKKKVPGWEHERFDSPQRLRLGGIGTPLHETTCSWGGFEKGIPVSWESIDPNNPPIFESEASYLKRLNLLTAFENKWLAGHPEALKPEKVIGYI